MSVQFVQSNQVTAVNSENFGYPANPDGTSLQIPCSDTEIIGSYWRIPQMSGPRVVGYQYIVDNGSSVPPQEDALKILRVKLTNTAGITSVDFAIADDDNVGTSSPANYFAYLCDGLGGSLPVMPTVVIPIPIQQQARQSTNSSGDNTFIFALPNNPNGLEYDVLGVWFNGIAPSPDYDPSGITTASGFATWADSNWGDYGTWTSPAAGIVQLVSTTSDTVYVENAGIVSQLTAVNWCFDLTAFGASPAQVNGVAFGSGETIPLPAFMLTNNTTTLLNKLAKVMPPSTIFNQSVTDKLGINTVMPTPKLYSDTTLISTAGSGVCS